jgi:chromosome segregation ATPase
MDADLDYEQAKWAYYKKNYETDLKKKLQEQINYLAKPLASMQKDIDELRKSYEAAGKAKDWETLLKNVKEVTKAYDELEKARKEYSDYAEKAVENFEKQTLLAWHGVFEQEAEKNAIKQIKGEVKWKAIRVRTGIALKGTAIILGVAATVAASIASFGVAPLALIIVIASLEGLNAVGGSYKLIKTTLANAVNMEDASVKKIAADLEQIKTMMGTIGDKSGGLPKHLSEASKHHSLRREKIKEADKQVDVLATEIKKLKDKLPGLRGINPELVKKEEDKIKSLENKKTALEKSIQKSMKTDEEMNKVFKEAEDLVGDLKKIQTETKSKLEMLLKKLASPSADDALQLIEMMDEIVGII